MLCCRPGLKMLILTWPQSFWSGPLPCHVHMARSTEIRHLDQCTVRFTEEKSEYSPHHCPLRGIHGKYKDMMIVLSIVYPHHHHTIRFVHRYPFLWFCFGVYISSSCISYCLFLLPSLWSLLHFQLTRLIRSPTMSFTRSGVVLLPNGRSDQRWSLLPSSLLVSA
jgi:hypothetical protein